VTAAPVPDLVSIDVTGSTATGVLLTVRGEVDSSTAPQLREVLDTAFAGGVPTLTIDLDAVTFLDSAGLCVLARAHRHATEAGVALRVLASSRAVVRPLQITGLYDLLAVEQPTSGVGAA
jgi:anti-sigma B factor antagonist